jgi:hypothetical protein
VLKTGVTSTVPREIDMLCQLSVHVPVRLPRILQRPKFKSSDPQVRVRAKLAGEENRRWLTRVYPFEMLFRGFALVFVPWVALACAKDLLQLAHTLGRLTCCAVMAGMVISMFYAIGRPSQRLI